MNKDTPIYCTKEKSCYCPKCQPINMTSQEIKDTQEEKLFEEKGCGCGLDVNGEYAHGTWCPKQQRLVGKPISCCEQARADERKKMVAVLLKAFYDFSEKEQDFLCNQRVLKLRNDLKTKFTQ